MRARRFNIATQHEPHAMLPGCNANFAMQIGKMNFPGRIHFSNLHCEVCVAAWKHCMGFMLCGNIEPPCPHLSFDTMENVRMKLMFFVFLLCAAPAWCGVPG